MTVSYVIYAGFSIF